jgi:two-component system, cell cycle sensor histidine kinase and response regulator CckA
MKNDDKTTETVLLVDDEEMVIDASKQMLQALGYDVLVAKDGNEAVRLCQEKKERIDLAILDVTMPGISGVDTGRKLKQIKPNIKIFLSSGYPLDYLSETTAMLEYEGFLEKPFGIDTLSGKLLD